MKRNRGAQSLNCLVMMLGFFVLACSESLGGVSDGAEPAYLEEVIPPCVPVESGDPCQPITFTPYEDNHSPDSGTHHSTIIAFPRDGSDPDFVQVLNSYGTQLRPVHIVIRGVVNPNSTRCGIHPIKPANYAPEEVHIVDWSDTLFYHCFVDITVREYIVGEGPPLLTIAIGLYTIDSTIAESYSAQELEERYGHRKSKVAAKFEGKELVVFLTTPLTLTVESWSIKGFFTLWYVQKGENGEYRAVSTNIVYAQTEEDRQHLDMLLTDLVQEVKAAALKRNELTGGRVTDDPSTPMLVTDANYLSDFYKSAGAVYDDSEYATVLPPPVPGEDDPDPGTVPTDEGTTVSSTPVPGEETTAPPTTDDASLTVEQETTTTEATNTTAPTTTEATETATTTTEPVPTEPVTGTTTTVPVADPGEEEVAPAPNEPPGEETETTTSLTPTEITTTPSNDDGAPSTDDDDTEPEVNDNPGEAQPTTTTLIDE